MNILEKILNLLDPYYPENSHNLIDFKVEVINGKRIPIGITAEEYSKQI